jgi:hypothetical protein
MKRLAFLGVFAVALALVGFAGVPGCGDSGDGRNGGPFGPRDNLRPVVTLTGAPPQGDTTRFDVELSWTAWDPDGAVDHFLYCVDPPDSADADTVWEETEAYSVSLIFTAEDYDTTTIDEFLDYKRHQIGVEYHVFILKAVDDAGAMSVPDYAAFNASTICPRTQIVSPPPYYSGWNEYMGSPQPVGLRVTFRWEGNDPDGVFTDKPIGYYYKLTDVTGEYDWRNVAPRLYEDPEPWVRVGAESTKVTLDLQDGRAYGFGVRAIDEAEAVEPLLVLNRNLLWVVASERKSYPQLTVSSTAFGVRHWMGWSLDTESYEVPLNSAYELEISGDAGWYGGVVTGYSYGWDLTDLDIQDTDPNGIGAWTPWAATAPTITAQFTEPRDYFLYIRCKDDLGGKTLAVMRFNVVAFTASRNVIYIDDCRMYPRDLPDDETWQRMLSGYDYGGGWSGAAWDEWDAPYGQEVPPLSLLAQFKVVVWSMCDNRMMSPIDKSAWFFMNVPGTANVLALYLGGETQSGVKGKVWAFGTRMVESSVLPYAGRLCEYPFAVREHAPIAGCYIRKGSFAYDYLHLIGDLSGDDSACGGARVSLFSSPEDKMRYVYVNGDPLPVEDCDLIPAADLYPNLPPKLEPDLSKPYVSAWLWSEVLEYPSPDQSTQLLFCDPEHGETGLVPLYRYKAVSSASAADGKFCGFRYIPRGSFDHGELVYFFFRMYPMYDDQARATAKVVLSDWFGLPDPDAGEP